MDLFKPLSDHFNAFFIDMLGMGLSSREPYEPSHAEYSRDYFVRFIEAWRISKGLDKFYLVGHSLGGYISSLYAIQYPERVKKLLLVSPIGFNLKPVNFDIRRIHV